MSLAASPLQIVMPVTLEGSTVRLEPIRREHAEIFWEVAKDFSRRYLPMDSLPRKDA